MLSPWDVRYMSEQDTWENCRSWLKIEASFGFEGSAVIRFRPREDALITSGDDTLMESDSAARCEASKRMHTPIWCGDTVSRQDCSRSVACASYKCWQGVPVGVLEPLEKKMDQNGVSGNGFNVLQCCAISVSRALMSFEVTFFN